MPDKQSQDQYLRYYDEDLGYEINGHFIFMLYRLRNYPSFIMDFPEISSIYKNYKVWVYDFTRHTGNYLPISVRERGLKKVSYKHFKKTGDMILIPRKETLLALLRRTYRLYTLINVGKPFRYWKKKHALKERIHYHSEACLLLRFYMEQKYGLLWDTELGDFIGCETYEINDYLSVRYDRVRAHTYILINGKLFKQCSYLLFNLDTSNLEQYDEVGSIDEMRDKYSHGNEGNRGAGEIDPEAEFWGHCSNLQAWYEHNYDTRILDSKLAFPLLKELAEAGDKKAKRVFKEEIAKRWESSYKPTQTFLREEGYLDILTLEEKKAIGIVDYSLLGEYKAKLVDRLSEGRLSELLGFLYDHKDDCDPKYLIYAYLFKRYYGDRGLEKIGVTADTLFGKYRVPIKKLFFVLDVAKIYRFLIHEKRIKGDKFDEERIPFLLLKQGFFKGYAEYAIRKAGFGVLFEEIDPQYRAEILERFSTKRVLELILFLDKYKRSHCDNKAEIYLNPILEGLGLKLCGVMGMEKKYCSHYQEFAGFKSVCMCPKAGPECDRSCSEKSWCDYLGFHIDYIHYHKITKRAYVDHEKQKEYEKRKRKTYALSNQDLGKFIPLDNFIGGDNKQK